MAEEDPKAPLTPPNYKDDPDFLPWLKQQEGFKDLFAEPTDPKAGSSTPSTPTPPASSTTSGGGQTVAANQAQDVMGSIVSAITSAAVKAGAEHREPSQATVVQQVAKKLHPIWGYEVD